MSDGRSMDAKVRYLAVATSCALLHNAVMIGCDWIGVHYLLSSGVSFTTVVLWSYPLHARFTFGQRLSAKSFLHYALGMATNYPASIVLMFLFYDLAGLSSSYCGTSEHGHFVRMEFYNEPLGYCRQAHAAGRRLNETS